MAGRDRVPAPRESIDDHLAAAGRRFPELVGKKAGSRAWVRDLVRRRIISAPTSIKKRVGRGRGERFCPRDYRALLEVLRVRAQGHKHRRTWLIWLWLRGRDYPLQRVREAIAKELAASLKAMRDELNPSGRSTEPFITKYRRNIVPKRGDSPFPDLGGIEELLGALMMRPAEAPEVSLDLSPLAALSAELLGVEEPVLRQALKELAVTPPGQAQSAALKFADVLPEGPMRTIAREFGNADPAELPPTPQLAGLIDDGRGHSTLLSALRAASDEQLYKARAEIQALRTGRFEHALRDAAAPAPAEQAHILLFMADWTRLQRRIHRGNPALSAYLFCIHVKEGGPPIPVDVKSPTDVNALLTTLREERTDHRRSPT